MKMSTLMLAGMLSLAPLAAFAEGGAERSKEFFDSFSFIQEKTHGTAEQTASSDASSKPDSAGKTADDQQPKS